MLRHELSLLDFAGLDRADFAFVGRADDLGPVARTLGETLGSPMAIASVDAGALRLGEAARREIDAVRSALTSLLRDEIAFYDRWTSDGPQPHR